MAIDRVGRGALALLMCTVLAACQGGERVSGPGSADSTTSVALPATTTSTTLATTTTTSAPTTTTTLPIRLPVPEARPRCTFGLRQPLRWDVFADESDDSDQWQFSTPEDQGMNSEVLLAGWPGEDGPDTLIRSLLVVRNDTIVAEGYFNGRDTFESGDIYSASKSIISALVGIAVREGHIEGLDQTVAEFFPGLFASLDDSAKSGVTIRQLLTMTAGVIPEGSPGYMDVYREFDWLRGIWGFDLVAEPGSAFNYNTGLTHTLSAIISTASGMSTCDFAYEHLFDPLGITVELWTSDPRGYFVGGSGIFITPREMAKFGLLYLHGGSWNGQQIVPAEWVEESTQPVVAATGGGYGYLWWPERIGGHDAFGAQGFGGQTILVIPDLDVVVVSTAAGDSHSPSAQQSFWLQDFVANHVVRSITGVSG